MQMKKKKRKGTPMEKAIDSMIADQEKMEFEKVKPMLTIRVGTTEEKK